MEWEFSRQEAGRIFVDSIPITEPELLCRPLRGFRIHPDSGVPIYLQLVQQVTHAIETGALRPEDQLPPIRSVAEDVVMNPNTVAKAYRELEYRGIVELRQGIGAFVRANSPAAAQAEAIRRAHRLVENAVATMRKLGLSEPTMRRVFEAELTQEHEVHAASRTGGKS